MPRHGSRAWLVHQLADLEAYAIREVYGEHRVYPEDLYDHYSHLDLDELKEAASGLNPPVRGRPKGSRRYDWVFNAKLVREVERLRSRHSERGACEIVARLWRVDPKALRMRYRRARKR